MRRESTVKLQSWSLLLMALLAPTSLCPALGQSANYSLYKELEGDRKIIGPLVGHVTDTTASIWAYAGPRTTPVILEIAELETSEAPAEGVGHGEDADAPRKPYRARLDATPDPEKHHEVQFEVTGLRPLTTYSFAVRMAEDDKAVEPGVFTTAPPAGAKATFRMAVSSCFGGAYRRENGRTREVRGEYHADSWKLLMQEEPDFQLIIGDNVYADSADYNHLWDAYTLERVNNHPFSEAVRTIPTYAVWDDHDYGPNNSDRTSKGKEGSLRVFNEVFANPPRPGNNQTPGIFTSFSWGGVDFFLLDGRYHRAPNEMKDTPEKTFLGDAQLEWLIESLKASEAPFKVLVCGSTWRDSGSDGWSLFDHARRQLWKRLVENNINGVVYVSGDIHRCDLQMNRPEVGGAYFMPEIISSGLGSHGEHDPMGFVVADFDLTREDPVMTAHVIDGTGTETNMRRVRASDLLVREHDEDGH
jgi:alkaline phosphatase D